MDSCRIIHSHSSLATLRQLKQLLSDASARSESNEDDRVFASYQSQVSDLLVCIELLS